MVKEIKRKEHPVLLVDCGGFFSERFIGKKGKFITDRGLKAANLMGYAAMNVSPGEFSLGIDFLREQTSNLSFPLVASNLTYAEGIIPFTKRYVIVEAGDQRVAILGVMPLGIIEKMPRSGVAGVVEVIPPDKALASLLPGITQEADMVILLSQLGQEWTQHLVDTVEGIDIAIYGGKENAPAGCGENVQASSSGNGPQIPVLKANAKGSFLGYTKLSADGAGRITADSTSMIYLDEAVPMDEGIIAITGTDIKKLVAEERKKAAAKKEREIEKLQKLTPEEYMQKLLREQKGENKQ